MSARASLIAGRLSRRDYFIAPKVVHKVVETAIVLGNERIEQRPDLPAIVLGSPGGLAGTLSRARLCRPVVDLRFSESDLPLSESY